jgi:hypothetical protein
MFSLFKVILTGLCIISYAFMWYQGTMLPAWHALIWVSLAFVNDLDEYLYKKLEM